MLETERPGYVWGAKEAKHAKELADKLRVSFLATRKGVEPTDADLLHSLQMIISKSENLTPFFRFSDVPKLNEHYNAVISEIRKPGSVAINGKAKSSPVVSTFKPSTPD